jgi:hypothetical protein
MAQQLSRHAGYYLQKITAMTGLTGLNTLTKRLELIMQASEFMYANEVAAEQPVLESTLRYWASVGEGPKSFKVGRRRVWRRSDVEEFFADLEAAAK